MKDHENFQIFQNKLAHNKKLFCFEIWKSKFNKTKIDLMMSYTAKYVYEKKIFRQVFKVFKEYIIRKVF